MQSDHLKTGAALPLQDKMYGQLVIILYFLTYCSLLCCSMITSDEITQLRTLVTPKIPESSKVYNLTKDDLYLEKWLSASRNTEDAAQRLVNHIKWRENEHIDKLDKFDWSYFQTEYVIVSGHHDKLGRPLAEMWLSDWNVRGAILSGRRRQLSRWISKMVEHQQHELYEARRLGSNATTAALLIDADGFNYFIHGCPPCLQVFSFWGQDWETNYPGLYEKVVAVKAPPSFHILTTTLKAALNSPTAKSFLVQPQGNNFKGYLDQWIDPEQRTLRFGGNLTLTSADI